MNREERRAVEKRVRRSRRIYKITIDPLEFPDYEDLVVKAHSLPLGDFLTIAGLAAGWDLTDLQNLSEEDVQKLDVLFETFANSLIEWNLDDEEGNEVPCTIEGLKGEDADFVLRMIMRWMEAIASVSNPLAQGSNNGPSPLAQQMQPATS